MLVIAIVQLIMNKTRPNPTSNTSNGINYDRLLVGGWVLFMISGVIHIDPINPPLQIRLIP